MIDASGPVAEIKAAVLSLLSTRPGMDIRNLDEAQWRMVSKIATQHLLGPVLHSTLAATGRAEAVPEWISREWAAAYRTQAIRSLVLQRALRHLDTILDERNIAYCALKGARLAWCDYPDPAMRPMRDLDILVPADRALDAYGALLETGYARYDGRNRDPAETLGSEKHLPPIYHVETGVQIEVHTRIFDSHSEIRPGARMADPAYLLAQSERRALGAITAAVLPREEAIAHCVSHSCYDSRFTNGPIAINDLHVLIRGGDVDWPKVWSVLADAGWTRGATLLFALVEQLHGPQPIVWPEGNRPAISRDLTERAALSMMVDKNRQRDAKIRAHAANEGKLTMALQLITARKYQLMDFARSRYDGPLIWLLYPAWAVSRVVRIVRSNISGRHRSEAGDLALVTNWLREDR